MPNPDTPTHDYVIFSSGGNDSIALVQWMIENKHTAFVVYSDTGWAQPGWLDRVARVEAWCSSHGFTPVRIGSMGLPALVQIKKAWPRNGLQFCTSALKIEPGKAWLAEVDPDAELTCCVGVRRAESARRSTWPEHVEESGKHVGRSLWSPLVRHTDEERDALLARAGFEPLPHRSQECYPCINANRADLRLLTPERVDEIEALEQGMGHTSKGKPRTMFRPYRHRGAQGIREVMRWATAERGRYHMSDEGAAGVRDTEGRIAVVAHAQAVAALAAYEGTDEAERAGLVAAVEALEAQLAEMLEDGASTCDSGMCGI